MRFTFAFVALMLALAGSVLASVVSAFDNGWTQAAATDNAGSSLVNGDKPADATALSDASLERIDYFFSPSKILVNELGAYNTKFTYDLKLDMTAPLAANPEIISGGNNGQTPSETTGFSLNAFGDASPASIPPESQEVPASINAPDPSIAQFETVMTNLSAFEVLGSALGGPENSQIGSVSLAPEPAAIGLLALAPMALFRRRRFVR